MPPPAQAPMPTGPSGVDNAPRGAPMMSPQVPAGEMAEAKVQVLVAIKGLTKALSVFQPTTPEGKALMNAIKSLAGQFGKDEESTEELQPAFVKQQLAGLAGPGQGPQGPPGGGAPPPPGAVPPGGAPPPPAA